jgi:hypothetical protein
MKTTMRNVFVNEMVKMRFKTIFGYLRAIYKSRPLYVLSSISLMSWATIMLFDNRLVEVYGIFSFLPWQSSSLIYLIAAISWPVAFYSGRFRSARVSILIQGFVHITNGLNFIPSIVLDFPGAMTAATMYILLGLLLIDSWNETPTYEVFREE